MKKSISLFLCIILLFAAMPTLATVSDLEIDAPYHEEVETIIALGIMEPVDYARFNPKQPVTRAEFVAYAVKISGFDSVEGLTDTGFYDVAENHHFANEIAYAKNIGMISGDGNGFFRPDSAVSFVEAAKILCFVTGHSIMAETKQDSTSQYLNYMIKLGISDGVSLSRDDIVGRGDAAKLIYNTLFANVIAEEYIQGETMIYGESEETVLFSNLDIYYTEGRVTANRYTSLIDDKKSNIGDVEIEFNSYTPNDYFTDDLLGYMVKAYYKKLDDGRFELVYVTPKNDNILREISAEDIISVENNVITYENDNRTKKLTVPKNIYVINNGEADLAWDMNDFLIDAGKLIFLDNDYDGDADIVDIRKYENYYVISVDKDEMKLYLRDGGVIDLNPDNDVYFSVIDCKTGKTSNFSSIAVNTMISVFEGINKKVYTIYTNNKCISGVLSEYGDEEVVIGGTTYPLYNEFDVNHLLGETITVWIDCTGKAAMLDEKQKNKEPLGFVLAVGNNGRLNSAAELKMLTADNEIKIFEVTKNVSVDGKRSAVVDGQSVKISGKNLPDVLAAASVSAGNKDGTVSQLIRYRTNEEGVITSIDTAMYNKDSEDEKSLQLSKLVTNNRLYCRNGRVLYDMDDYRTVCNVASNAKVFIVPSDVSERDSDDDNLSVRKGNVFTTDGYYTGTSSKYAALECYNNNDAQTSEIVVLYAKAPTSYSDIVPNKYLNRAFAVSKVRMVLADNDEYVYEFTGYARGALVKYQVTNVLQKKLEELGKSITQEYKFGDVVALEIDNGKINNIRKLFSYSDTASYTSIYHTDSGDTLTGSIYEKRDASFFGNLYSYSGGYMSLNFSNTATPDLLSFYVADCQTVLICDMETETYSIASVKDFVGSAETGGTSNNVYVYACVSLPYLIISYKK